MKKILLFLFICVISSKLLFAQNIDISVDIYQPNCPGGTATVYAYASISSNFSFWWSSDGSTNSFNFLTAGTYTVIVTDLPTGDTAMATVVITDPPGPTITPQTPITICPGISNGNINLDVSGISEPYFYNWSNGTRNKNLYNVMAGQYSVTVSDANGCQYYLNDIVIPSFQSSNLSMSSTNAGCGLNDGSVTAYTGTTTGTSFFLWDDPNNSTSETVTNLYAGTYNVTITTDHGCLSYGSAIVNNTGAPFLNPYPSNILCNGSHTGSANISVQGGTPPFTYLWSNNDTLNFADSLSAGPINVTVSDGLGCKSIRSLILTEPPALNVNMFKNDVPCANNSTNGGSIWVSVTGGMPNYTYLWSNLDTTYGIYNLLPGIYFVTVTDMNGCSVVLSDTVFDAVPLVVNFTKTDPTCFGGWNGSIDVTVSGGVPPYGYYWSGGQSYYSYNEDASGLSSGYYYLNTSDQNGCSLNVPIILTDPLPMTITDSITNILCYGDSTGIIDITVENGIAPYSYSWDFMGILHKQGTTSETPLKSNGFFSNSQDITNGPAGYYTITVTDSLGCTFSSNYSILEQQPTTINIYTTSPHCGLSDGNLYASIYGISGPYTYNWSNGDTSMISDTLTAGQYSLTLTDLYGCQTTSSALLNNASGPIISLSSTGTSCFGSSNGTATVSISPQPTSETFLWSNGSTSPTISGISSGTYFVTATDAFGCMTSGSVFVTQPDSISISFNTNNPICAGDSNGYVNVYASGSSYNFSYLWNNNATTSYLDSVSAGTYTVTVTDNMDLSCQKVASVVIISPPQITINSITVTDVTCTSFNNGSITINATAGNETLEYAYGEGQFGFDNTFTQLSSGNYHIQVRIYVSGSTGYNSCVVSTNNDIIINEPTELTGTFEQTNISCYGVNNGTISFIPFGGTPPYQYSIDETTFGADSLYSNLQEGFYPLIIKDANNCIMKPGDATIQNPVNIFMNLSGSTVNCSYSTNGQAGFTVYGGFPPYLFNWSNGTTTQNNTNLAVGTYLVTVSDNHNCNYIDSAMVVGPNAIQINPISSNTLCFGSADGSIDLTTTGGTPIYSFIWDDGAITEDRSGLNAGNYFVTVTDNIGCIFNSSITITQPTLLALTVSSTNASCNGLCDGTGTVSVIGGTAPYTYSWSNLVTTSITTACAGSYSVTVTDNNNCISTSSVTITEPAILTLSTTTTQSACNLCSGTATAIPSGGTTPYSFLWNNNDITITTDSLCAGTILVSVTDANGCMANTNANIAAQALSSINGNASWTGGLIPDNNADVELYRILNITQAELAYTMPLTNSTFSFSNITNGQYFLKVNITNGANLPHVLSSYLDSTYLWELADTIHVACASNFNLHVPMYEMTQPTGTPIGVISGYITYGDYQGGKGITLTDGAKLVGEPVPGAEVYVELEPDDEPIINTTTNDSGFYFVSGLEGGNSYSMSVDIPGLPMITTYTNFAINGDSTQYTQMNFFVDTSETNGGIFINPSSSIIKYENAQFDIEMYPNPFTEILNINYNLNKPGNVNLEIYDMIGNVVSIIVKEKQNEGTYKYTFNASSVNLAEGTYIVKIQVNNTLFIKKILQIK